MAFKLDLRREENSIRSYIYLDENLQQDRGRLILTVTCNSFWEIDDEIYKLIGELERLRKRAKAEYDKPVSQIATHKADMPETLALLKATDVAARLNISKSQAYQLMRRNEIPTVRFGHSIRVRPEDLEAYIQDRIQN